MRNKVQRISSIILLSILILITSLSVFGQATQQGDWKAKVSNKDTQKINISFYREKTEKNYEGKHKNHVNSSSYEINDLQGLSVAQINSLNSQVNFSILREAGTIQLVGSFNNGTGSGTWTFSPDANFISIMSNLGFENISDQNLFASAMLDVKTATVTELRNSGLKVLDYEDIFKATIFKVNGNFVSEMNAAGFNDLDIEDLVQARIFKIDAKYAGEVVAIGFGKQTIEDLVQFRIFKITPEFLTQMRSEGLTNLTSGDLVQLRIFKIDSKFIQQAREKGFANLSVGELVELKIHGKVN